MRVSPHLYTPAEPSGAGVGLFVGCWGSGEGSGWGLGGLVGEVDGGDGEEREGFKGERLAANGCLEGPGVVFCWRNSVSGPSPRTRRARGTEGA